LLHSLGESVLNLSLGSSLELQAEGWVSDHLLNTGNVGLELLTSLELLGESIIGALEFLGILNHLLDLRRGKLSNRVGNGDVGGTSSGLLSGGDLEDTVDVDLEDDLKDGLTSLHWWDRGKGELSEGGVILAVDTLSLVDWELNGGLVVGNSGEGSLLDGWDGLTTGDDWGEDVTLHGNTKGKWDDIQEKEVSSLLRVGVSGKDTGLNGGTVGNSLIWVDRLLELLAIEEVGKELLDLWNTGRTTDKDNLVNLGLLEGSILQDLLNWLDGGLEESSVELLELGTGDRGVEVLTSGEGVNLDGGLGDGRKSTLSTFASRAETAEGTWVITNLELGLALELSLEVVKESGIEILSTKMGVTSSSLDSEDTT
jgi:hypothetical protein